MNFLEKIQRWFQPPTFPDDENKTRVAAIINFSLWVLFFTVLLIEPFIFFVPRQQTTGFLYLSAIFAPSLLGVLLYLLRKGYVNLTAWTFVFFQWISTHIQVFASGGLQSPAIGAFSVTILLAGFLINDWAGLLFTILSILSIVWVQYAESLQLLPTPLLFQTSTGKFAMLASIMALTFTILIVVVRSLRIALVKSQATVQKLEAVIKQRLEAEEKLQHSEQQLQNSLAEKELLLKEVHHRVKNNMQVIVSLLSLQAANLTDPVTSAMMRESQNRVRSMALVHEKLYQSNSLAKIDLRDYLQHLAATLFHSYSPYASHIELAFAIEEATTLDIDQAIPCGLIVNELVSNSLKHAFPNHRHGKICVGLKRVAPNKLNLYVENTGENFPPEIDFRRTQSLGLQLILSLVKQLAGTIEMEPLTPGTRFSILFEATGSLTGLPT